jgi:hypothetical protein
VPKYVASRTLSELEWQNSTVLQGDVAEAVAALELVDDLRVDQYEAPWSPRVIGHAGQCPCNAALEPALVGLSTTSTDSPLMRGTFAAARPSG